VPGPPQKAGNPVGIASIVSDLAFLAIDEGDLAAARPLIEQSLALRQELATG